MDNKNSGESVHLTLPARITFLAAIGLLGFIWSTGTIGAIGLICGILAATLNIVMLLDAGNSVPWLLCTAAVNLGAYGASVAYARSFDVMLTALYPLIMAAAVYLTLRMKMGRAASIAAAALCGTVLLLSAFAAAVYSQFGVLNADSINAVLDSIYEPIIEYYNNLLGEIADEANITLAAVDAKKLLYYAKSMLIGSVGAVMIVFAYFITLAARIIASVFGVDDLLPSGLRVGISAKITKDGPTVEIFREPVKWRIELDFVSAVVYLVAYAVSVLTASSDNMSLPLMAAENLILILSPGFFYCGARDVVLGLRGKASMGRMSRFILIPAVILSLINPSSIIILLCALGVIVTFRENRARRKMQDNGKETK